MEKYIINGGKKLSGEIQVAGAKNLALKIFPAALLSAKPCLIKNVPEIEDIQRLIELMENLGVKITRQAKGQYLIAPENITKTQLRPDLVHWLRSSIMLAGPLLARFGEVTLTHPGGCVIGQRPIDLFWEGFKKMGAQMEEQGNNYTLKAKKLIGANIILPKVSVTVTENLMMAATLAQGTTYIKNAAMEPEIIALADYLNQQGAKIKGAGTPAIIIEGVSELNAGEFQIIPDRIEAGTFIILGLITKGEIKITGCNPEHLENLLYSLDKAGAKLEIGNDYIITKPSDLKGTNIITHEYPGFPTDLQAPFTVLMTQAQGLSLIHETIFDGRLFYTDMLNQMGANIIMCDPHRVVVMGPSQLYGKRVVSPDLRAGMALILAALTASGTSTIENVYQINRGYENIVSRLQNLQADIKQIND
ncbi:MAG: UDP-N-acetylglucosamine 1-carboxyvinyltransferase [Candidatus Buchananbacteria bacterium RBG_13_36_9]|uniref:UDP-N-acetylglucosamine 1-carboxyvinyltransferase n=1 Tax=Candidatus Buchananbacteria bacterium RBG_13_36_9 TaxID=1797530 RepID=A0A1G1XM69_9BACT|nr:MAG: UDP-N-acetylglucosamine 1-carboxyvinyltransferase [Candidatus Buchananbacteria bacterium RBG_13_36_9]